MNLLLDTNALLRWLSDSPRLGREARALISDPDHQVFVSVVSLWEIAIKVRIGKLQADVDAIDSALDTSNFQRLGIAPAHLTALVSLPSHHRDPFDHLLMAQAISERAVFLTSDDQAALYPVQWRAC